MEVKKDPFGLLDLMIRPGFCVKDNRITYVNAAAQALLLSPGDDVLPLLLTGREEYAEFSEGCLYLKLALTKEGCGAAVVATEAGHLFLLDMEPDNGQLRSLALAARELREPLTGLMISAQQLMADAEDRDQAARLNRSLHRLLRIVGNMSDAGHSTSHTRQETRDIPALLAEVFEKARTLADQAGLTLCYQGLDQEIMGLVDAQQLERAVLNILSNALKFTPKGGHIDAKLTRRGHMLSLSITDSGSGIAENIRSSVFSRYLRQPGIEDSRYGLGLGLVLVRSAAANHGGAVLIDHPAGKGTRVTLTLSVRQSTEGTLRSPILQVDYTGEQDHGLLELADCLPWESYKP